MPELEIQTYKPCEGKNCGSTNPNFHSQECFLENEEVLGNITGPGNAPKRLETQVPHLKSALVMYETTLPDADVNSIQREVIFDLLDAVIGEDVLREGLLETPSRVVKAWKHWTSGYSMNPADILKVFEDGADGCDQMVVRKDIPIYSHCEHHMAAIIGKCTIAYIPRGKIVGLSKMDRLADMYARRLQVQERMTNQIADAMWQYLDPVGVGVWISARHLCVESRGVSNSNSETITTALRGAMLEDPATRAEFLAITRS